MKRALKRNEKLLKPFKNLWPDYTDHKEFAADLSYDSVIKVGGVNELIDFVNDKCIEMIDDRVFKH